jgi:DNA polymerase-4
MERIEHSGTTGRTVTLKVKFSDFRQITRSRTLQNYISNFQTLHEEVTEIRKSLNLEGTKIRLLGVSISNLESDDCKDRQLFLFDEE